MDGTVFELTSRLRATLPGRLLLVCAGIGAGAAAGSVAGALLPLVLPVHPEVLPHLPGWMTLTGVFLGAVAGDALVGIPRMSVPFMPLGIAMFAKTVLGLGAALDPGEWLRMVVPPLACLVALAAAIPSPRPGERPSALWDSLRGFPAPRQP